MTNQELIQKVLTELQKEIIDNINRAGQNATGKTVSLFSVENVTEQGGELWGAAWTRSLEEGRGLYKGSTQYVKGDFKNNLKKWIIARGIIIKDEADLERKAKFFAWWINKNGTELYQKGGRKDIYTNAIENATEKLVKGISALEVQKIINSI